MKKKFLSLILVLMLLPIASIFGACGKDKGYNLNNLQKDYTSIAEENNNIVCSEDGKLSVDYSKHPNLTTVIDSTSPYSTLKDYNYVFENLMAFVNGYIDECSNNQATKNVEIKNQVKQDLDVFKKSIGDTNECINIFAEIMVVANEEDLKAQACLLRFENLLVSYEKMFNSAITFSNSLTDLYYNNILKEGNPNVYELGFDNFNAGVVVNQLESRLLYQQSNLSQNFVEMYLNETLANEIANETASFDLNHDNYQSNIEALKLELDFATEGAIGTAVDIANNDKNKENVFNLAVKLFNIQATLNNEQYKFVRACKDIDYSIVKNSEDATSYQLLCVDIIDANYDLISEYNQVLSEIVAIINSAV